MPHFDNSGQHGTAGTLATHTLFEWAVHCAWAYIRYALSVSAKSDSTKPTNQPASRSAQVRRLFLCVAPLHRSDMYAPACTTTIGSYRTILHADRARAWRCYRGGAEQATRCSIDMMLPTTALCMGWRMGCMAVSTYHICMVYTRCYRRLHHCLVLT